MAKLDRKPKAEPPAQKLAWHRIREQLVKPKQLNRKEIERRQRARDARVSERHRMLSIYLLKAGIGVTPDVIGKWLLRICIILNIVTAAFLVVRLSSYFKYGTFLMAAVIVLTWLATFLMVLFLMWLVLYLSLDILIYRRKVKMEEVLPDFLLLASANIRAGMPVDRALWYAVRPRFGVLAKEIEHVAKETMTGEDLVPALESFASKYDSPMLKNAVNLLTESINAGGEIGGLLSKISANIQQNELLKKEMAAGISAYAIFIGAAAVAVAPVLFALSSQLLTVITEITSGISLPTGVSMPLFSMGGSMAVGVKHSDFMIFAFVNLFFTSFFSAIIITILRKGEVRAGLKYIPIFIATSSLIFFLATKAFSGMFGGMF